ncbi:DUF6054 family protein [Streptococcus gallinaceus]|uniref:Uncharacterized protein n=1 Tax=Streptococcus gallinaceus TaxID=165758 RepID=A0ABV2JL25_9STRE|nr:DUF6054 family protein [Streptococcus gallinaceus]MCP1639759.1 hypothetical protein [Streptococcus gallinaceus]MCP1770542.1 hypothetical protein [Streptococcus gallinaceus]
MAEKSTLVTTQEVSFTAIQDALCEKLVADPVNIVHRRFGSVEVMELIFEKYYFRTESFACLTILLLRPDDKSVQADITAAAAGVGILDISWGSQKDFLKKGKEILEEFGFH